MTLDTTINSALVRPLHQTRALVLMGGGARTAYQVGVLRALAALLRLQPGASMRFPFQVLVGTSAGAINAAFLASAATHGLDALDRLAGFWSRLDSRHVYRLELARWARWSRITAAMQLWATARRQGAVLDSMPLIDTLHRRISLAGIDEALLSGAVQALAVTASSYSTGVHWTFCHTARDLAHPGWSRPGRRAAFQHIGIEHLLASSAIPFLFPAMPLWVDERREYFGDGAMRQISPLSPAMHLGAHQILVIGVGQPQRTVVGGPNAREPGFGDIAGHALASVFHDTLQADVEQAQRVTRTLQQLPREVAAVLPYRPLEVLALQPSQSLDALALKQLPHLGAPLRRALAGLGALANGAPLASYLLFEPEFVQTLVALGERDAYARKHELLAFFT
ncbi:patatin-like phospholipase family protein [Ramlibacter sp. AN1015]|uniref:patatin-like phospholipase family protein n=1 Tax=Ramlibacter sp. AN1015 TaxID=3133428 RepID=UPI0030C4E080